MTSPQRSADQLTDADLVQVGFAEPSRARRLLIGLAGRGVTDDDVAELLPSLLDALADCPDPDRALANFARWSDALGNRATHFRYLRSHPAGVRILVQIGASSQFLADILAHDPEYAEIVANPNVRSGAKPDDELYRELAGLVGRIAHTDLKLEAMRRFRQREVLRIATRDLLGLADMPTTAEEFSNLADACIQICMDVAHDELVRTHPELPPARIAVIALGKLGGRELNYSSDIDLVFIAADEEGLEKSDSGLVSATRLAELVVAYLSRDMRSGHLFRVDTRLRPEGRFGSLVRTLASYRSYYENWAETWELQAMLKARYVAGDRRIGQAFLEMLVPFVYPNTLTETMLREMRSNKRRMEQRHLRSPDPSANVKTGIGGIRDVEFTIQLLQMRAGAHDPLVRTPNTLDAIARLRQAGLLSAADADTLAEGYVFLRNVEHRLQLLYDRQTQDLPTAERELELLARRLGFSGASEFRERYRAVTTAIRSVHERLFYNSGEVWETQEDEWSAELFAIEAADRGDEKDKRAAEALLRDRLAKVGFQEPERAVQLIRMALIGTPQGRESPEAAEAFRALARFLFRACGHSADPDAALLGISLLADASPNRAQWYHALRTAPDLLNRLVRLAAGSRTLVQTVARRPEWLDLLVSDEIVVRGIKPREAFASELSERLSPIQSTRLPMPAYREGTIANDGKADTSQSAEDDAFEKTVALYCQRERLRIGARELWGETSAPAVSIELSYLADAVLERVLRHSAAAVAPPNGLHVDEIIPHLAVIGLGKLGGLELSFYSDLDVLFVCDDAVLPSLQSRSQDDTLYSLIVATAEHVMRTISSLRQEGVPLAIDVRLRPEGRFGPLVASPTQLEAYFGTRAEVWERQTLLKARYVAGSGEVASHFLSTCQRFVYERPFTEEEADAVRAMKSRIESERLNTEDRFTNIKLGHGGMSDIEFLVQLLQLRYGRDHISVRATRTLDALDALAEVGAIPSPDAERLNRNYRFLSRLRNRLALLTGQAVDIFPADPRRVRALAVGFGIADTPSIKAEAAIRRVYDRRMRETRRIFERLFHGNQRKGGQ